MLSFINNDKYKDISGYDIEIINMNLRGNVNKNRIRFIEEHLKFNLEKDYIDFLNNNIAVVFKVDNKEEKLINLYYAYESVKQNLDNEIYEKYSLEATIIGKIVGEVEENIFLMNYNGEYGVYVVNKEIRKIGDSFRSVFTEGIGTEKL